MTTKHAVTTKNEIAIAVLDVIKDELCLDEQPDVSAKFGDLGVSSLDVYSIIYNLEDVLGIDKKNEANMHSALRDLAEDLNNDLTAQALIDTAWEVMGRDPQVV